MSQIAHVIDYGQYDPPSLRIQPDTVTTGTLTAAADSFTAIAQSSSEPTISVDGRSYALQQVATIVRKYEAWCKICDEMKP